MLRATGQKKSLIVVAVSSPYDFAMDKTVGTYICTYDFTETGMNALVRALMGEFPPRGTFPGTLRKSKKVVKSRQRWLVEDYDRDRDGPELDALIQATARASTPSMRYLLEKTTSATFQLSNPRIQESHFVVRNSSTQALYGFCATYVTQGGVGIIGVIFVDPAKRNVSIGRSLQRGALRELMKRGVNKMQLGTSLPGVFPGIPIDEDGASAKAWFANSGWDVQFPRRLTNMTIADLASWTAPEGLLASIQRASISFDLIHGHENAETVLAHVQSHASADVCELYRLALHETKTCGVVRAKTAADAILGTVVICSPGSALATYLPALAGVPGRGTVAAAVEAVGGIVAPVLARNLAQATLVLQGLALMGVRQNKAHRSSRSVLSWVPDELYEPLLAMNFETLQAFEEITNSPDHVSPCHSTVFFYLFMAYTLTFPLLI